MNSEEMPSSPQEDASILAEAADLPTHTPLHRPQWKVRFVRWLTALLVVGYVLWFLVEKQSSLSSLRNLSAPILVLLFGLSILNSFLYALRFRRVVQEETGLPIPCGSWLRLFLISRLFSMLAGQTGTRYRIWTFKREYGVSIARFLAAALFLTWFDTCLFVLLGTAVVAVLAPELALFGSPAWALSLAAGILFAIAPLLVDRFLSILHFSNRWSNWAHHRLLEITSAILTAFKNPLFLLSLAGGGILSFALVAVSIAVCFQGLGLHIELPGVVLFVAVLGLSNRIVITPGGNLGIKELAYGFLAEQLHIGMAQGILVSLLTRMVTMITTLTLGLAAGGRHLFQQSDLRKPTLQEGAVSRRLSTKN